MSPHSIVPNFYEISDFIPDIARPAIRHVNSDTLNFTEKSRAYFEGLMHYFQETPMEYAGVLKGEYFLVNDHILIRQDGSCIKANIDGNNEQETERVDAYCNSKSFIDKTKIILDQWDKTVVIENGLLMSHRYSANYFHYSLEVIPKIRFFKEGKTTQLIIPEKDVMRVFQKDLMMRAASDKNVAILNQFPIKVRDPILSQEVMSEEAILWLRKAVNLSIEPGHRRIYLRRSTHGTRSAPGGGVSETPDFLAFLKEYAFEIVDFGSRELSIEEQVKMLDKAAVILAPHGAALTNLAYLSPPLVVIEIICPLTPRAVFMHIASLLKFDYYGVFSDISDMQHNIVVDGGELREVMAQL